MEIIKIWLEKKTIELYIHDISVYIYIYRLKAGGSPELPGTLSFEPIL